MQRGRNDRQRAPKRIKHGAGGNLGLSVVYSLKIWGKEQVKIGGPVGLLKAIGEFIGGFIEHSATETRPAPQQNKSEASRASIQDINNAKLFSGSGIRLGLTGVTTRENNVVRQNIHYSGENHLITIGKPGSGKGTTVIVPALLTYEGSCLVIDPKGQNAAITANQRKKLGNRVFYLNPYGLFQDRLGATARFNPLAQLDPESDNFVGDVGSLAEALIYHTGGDAHWADSARELVACLIMYVCTQPGETKTLPRVRQILTRPAASSMNGSGTDTLLYTIADMTVSKFAPLANKAAQFSEATTEIKSIVSNARTQTAFLDDPKIAACLSGFDFSFAAMKRRPKTVYLILPAKHLRAQARWLRLLVTSAIDSLTDEPRKGDKRVLFVLDEFAQLGKLEAIEKALALVRGYGVQLWPFVQDLPQLKSVYPDRWESFLATAGIMQFFTPNDEMTAKYLSERCGKTLVLRKNFSESTSNTSGRDSSSSSQSLSSTTSQQWEPLFNDWELRGNTFPKSMQMLFVEGLSNVINCGRVPYFQDEQVAGLAEPDPYVNG